MLSRKHRSLVDDKKRVLQSIKVKVEARLFAIKSFLAVNDLMNRRSLLRSVRRKNFRRPSRWREEHHRTPQFAKRLDQRPDECRFARTGVAAEYESGPPYWRIDKLRQHCRRPRLFFSEGEAKFRR